VAGAALHAWRHALLVLMLLTRARPPNATHNVLHAWMHTALMRTSFNLQGAEVKFGTWQDNLQFALDYNEKHASHWVRAAAASRTEAEGSCQFGTEPYNP
jgi:hypothetical protein